MSFMYNVSSLKSVPTRYLPYLKLLQSHVYVSSLNTKRATIFINLHHN